MGLLKENSLPMDNFINLLLQPLAYEFMQRALMISILIASVCSIFSCFLVLKGWSLMGDAVSHAVLPGLCIAILVGIPMMIGAFIAGLFCAVATGYLKQNSRLKEDAVMGIIFSGMFALGLVLFTKIETDIHLLHILFGNVLGISKDDLIEIASIAITASCIMLIKRKDFMLYCFDPSHASVIGLPIKMLHFGLLILLALTIVAALKAAGVILVIAMLIAPGATGFLLTRSFDKMLIIALTSSVFSALTGTYLSYHMDAATAPLIVVIQAGLFVMAIFLEKSTKLELKPYLRS